MPRDEAILLDMALAARRAMEGLGGASLEEFSADWRIQSIVLHQLLILGEATKSLSNDFRDTHSQFPWRQIAGMRDILIHTYGTVDLSIVWEVVSIELPVLLDFLQHHLPQKV